MAVAGTRKACDGSRKNRTSHSHTLLGIVLQIGALPCWAIKPGAHLPDPRGLRVEVAGPPTPRLVHSTATRLVAKPTLPYGSLKLCPPPPGPPVQPDPDFTPQNPCFSYRRAC